MPEMDGIELLKKVRSPGNTIPFILFTGKGREEVVIEAINSGADFYLQKGGDPMAQFAELAHKVRQAVNRRRAEAGVRDLERRDADLINFLPDATFAIDTAGTVIAWNRAMEEMTGVAAAEVLGKGDHAYADAFYHERRPMLADLVLAPDEKFEKERYHHTVHNNRMLTAETTRETPGRPPVHLWAKASLLFDRDGNVAGAIEAIRDITVRKQAETELRAAYEQIAAAGEELRSQYDELVQNERQIQESEENFQSLVETAPDAIYISTGEQFVYVNPAMVRLMGAESAGQLIGTSLYDRIHPSFHEAIRKRVRTVVVERRPVGLKESVYLKMDGIPVDIESAVATFRYQDAWAGLVILRDITRRKQAERLLQESEGKYRTVVEQSQDAIFIAQDGLLAFHNPSFAAMTGYSSAELDGRSIADLIAPEDRDLVMTRHRERTKGAVLPEVYEFSVLHHDGTSRIRVKMFITAVMVGGKPATLGTLHNMTEERKREEALRESEERYRRLISNSFDAVVVHQDGRIVLANGAADRIFGAAPGAGLVGRSVLDLVVPEFRATVAERARQMLQSPDTAVPLIEEKFVRSDGTPFDVEVVATATLHEGRPAVMVVFRDITGRKQAETALRESQAKFRTVLDNIPDLVLVHRDGIILYVNPAMIESTGIQPDDVLNTSVFDYVEPVYHARVAAAIRGRAATGRDEPYEIEIVSRSGEHRIVLIRGAVIEFDGSPATLNVLTDITDRKRAEEALRESEANYRLVVEHSQDAIYIHRSDRLLFANSRASELTGYTHDELMDIRLWDLVHPDDRAGLVENAQNRFAGEDVPPGFNARLLTKDGLMRTCEFFVELVVYQGAPAVLGIARDITERVRAEEALRESEARFRELAELLPQIIFEMDTDLRITYVNRHGRTLIGLSPEDLERGYTAFDFIIPKDHERAKESARKILRGEEVDHHEFGAVCRNGTVLSVLIYTAPIQHDGDLAGFRGVVVDVTGRKRAEDALRESEEKFRTLFNNTNDGIYIYEVLVDYLPGKLLEVNEIMCSRLGYTRAELLAMSINDIVSDAHRPKMLEISKQFAKTRFHTFYAEHKRKDGSVFPVEVNSHRFTFSGRPVMLAVARDITERRHAEDALRESEEKYRHILENMQDAYFRADSNGHLSMVGPSAARVYGYSSPEEMIGIPATSLYGNPRQRDEMLRLLERDGRVTDFTGEARRKDGSLFWASIGVQYLQDSEGRRAGTETVVRDISGRRIMEQAIREANRKLNLLNTITRHDVANQLTALQGYVQLASMKKPDPSVTDFLLKIGEAADAIDRQIAFTRVYQELGVQAPSWFTLEDVVAKASGTAVPVRFSGTCRAVSILADPMLERVFFNLFENAVRHGKRVSAITVRCERDPDGLLVIVDDDGVGVRPHEKEKIFTKGYGKNTGFGLFLAREILAITGITIRETGSHGKGARFEMLVPKGAFRLPEGKGKKE